MRIPLKLYAEKLSLTLPDTLREWCVTFGMNLNARKCELLYFHGDQGTCKDMYTLGEHGLVPIVVKVHVHVMQSLPLKNRARYLRLHYES